jgi:hypothetical protein
MKFHLSKVGLEILTLLFVLLVGCDKKEESIEISPELQKIMDNGVTVDSISLDYATLFTSEDGFYLIEPKSREDTTSEEELMIYFKFNSRSRDDLFEYYSKMNEEYMKQGYTVDWVTRYYDKLEGISVKVKKQDDGFYQTVVDSSVVKLFVTPDINSGFTFAKYDLTLDEFLDKYKNSFPDYFIMRYDDGNLKSNTYVFKITFTFNTEKEFILVIDPAMKL